MKITIDILKVIIFAKKYKKKVILSIMLDPAFMGGVGKERLSDDRFVKFEKEIKDNDYSISIEK